MAERNAPLPEYMRGRQKSHRNDVITSTGAGLASALAALAAGEMPPAALGLGGLSMWNWRNALRSADQYGDARRGEGMWENTGLPQAPGERTPPPPGMMRLGGPQPQQSGPDGGIDLDLLEQFLAQMQGGGQQQAQAPGYDNTNFPSGGALPNYGFGDPSQMSKMGLTPDSAGSISGPAPRPQEYTAPLAEMTPPIMPGAGAIGRGLGAAMMAARPAAAPIAAGLGMTALSSGAGIGSESPLQQLYAQQKDLATRRDEAIRRRDEEGASGRGPRFKDADAEVRRIESELSGLNAMISDESKRNSPEYQLEMQRKADELAAEQKQREAATPFRERHPAIAGALPYAGYALGLGLPFMAGAKKNLGTFFPGSYPGRVSSGIRRAESAIAGGDRNAMALSGSELGNLVAARPKGLSAAKDAGAAAFAGGALGAESGIIPDVIDYANLPDGEGRDNALERMGDLKGHAIRIGTGGMLGLSGYKAGGILTPSRSPNIPRAEALRDFLNNPQTPALPAAPMGPPRLHHSNFQPRNRGQFAPGTPKYPKK